MTTAAIEHTVDSAQGAPFLSVVARFTASAGETAAELQARLGRLLVGHAEPLRWCATEAALAASLSLVSGTEYLQQLHDLLTSPAMPELLRTAEMDTLMGREPATQSRVALDLADDLHERFALLREALVGPHAEAVSEDEDRESFGQALFCHLTLAHAAFSREPWQEWQANMLWWRGREAVMAGARVHGFHPEEAVALLRTPRDAELIGAVPTRADSDEALRLLGLLP